MLMQIVPFTMTVADPASDKRFPALKIPTGLGFGSVTVVGARVVSDTPLDAIATLGRKIQLINGGTDATGTDVISSVAGIDTVGTKSSLSTDLAGDNNDIVWTAVDYGEAGDEITIEYVVPEDDDQAHAASVSVDGTAITVSLQVDTDGSTILSTADDIKTLVNADLEAGALVQGTDKAANDGSGVLIVMDATPLAGGVDPVTADDWVAGEPKELEISGTDGRFAEGEWIVWKYDETGSDAPKNMTIQLDLCIGIH